MTAEALCELWDDGYRCELVGGELIRMTLAGAEGSSCSQPTLPLRSRRRPIDSPMLPPFRCALRRLVL